MKIGRCVFSDGERCSACGALLFAKTWCVYIRLTPDDCRRTGFMQHGAAHGWGRPLLGHLGLSRFESHGRRGPLCSAKVWGGAAAPPLVRRCVLGLCHPVRSIDLHLNDLMFVVLHNMHEAFIHKCSGSGLLRVVV